MEPKLVPVPGRRRSAEAGLWPGWEAGSRGASRARALPSLRWQHFTLLEDTVFYLQPSSLLEQRFHKWVHFAEGKFESNSLPVT